MFYCEEAPATRQKHRPVDTLGRCRTSSPASRCRSECVTSRNLRNFVANSSSGSRPPRIICPRNDAPGGIARSSCLRRRLRSLVAGEEEEEDSLIIIKIFNFRENNKNHSPFRHLTRRMYTEPLTVLLRARGPNEIMSSECKVHVDFPEILFFSSKVTPMHLNRDSTSHLS